MEGLGSKVDLYYAARSKRIEAEKAIEDLKRKEDELKNELLEILGSQGLTMASGTLATISISEAIVPAVDNWEDFHNYIHRKKAYYLLERRPSSTAYREELDIRKGKDIPGVKPFVRKTLNMSKTNK